MAGPFMLLVNEMTSLLNHSFSRTILLVKGIYSSLSNLFILWEAGEMDTVSIHLSWSIIIMQMDYMLNIYFDSVK